jgi:hypothetical protein
MRWRSSSADALHLAFDGRPAIGAEHVFGCFLPGGNSEPIGQLVVRPAVSQYFFNGLVVVGQQAGAKLSIRGESQAVAMVAKMMAQCADKSNFSQSACDPVTSGRSVILTTAYRKQRS